MTGRRLFALAAILLLPLLLTACGESPDPDIDSEFVPRSAAPEGSPDEAAVATSDTPASTPAVSIATPNADGVYIVGCGDPLVPLDKLHRLEETCEPEALVPIPEGFAHGPQAVVESVLPYLLRMLEAAVAEGRRLAVVSGYRSYETQRITFQQHLDTMGLEEALRVSARPGHSEHQLGTTVDLSSASVGYALTEAFGETAEGRWLAERAHEFGFVISYPRGLEEVTGYVYEPWHYRWVGPERAAEVHASGLTLGQFLLR